MAERCGENCKFWEEIEVGELGRCRCNSPEPKKVSGNDYDGVWPMTRAEEWCGKYEQKEEN